MAIQCIDVYDNPVTGFAHNVYLDDSDGVVYIERVWGNQGVTVVSPNGGISVITANDFSLLR